MAAAAVSADSRFQTFNSGTEDWMKGKESGPTCQSNGSTCKATNGRNVLREVSSERKLKTGGEN
jgi:hypothetical protein